MLLAFLSVEGIERWGRYPVPASKVSGGVVPTQPEVTWSDGKERVEVFGCAGEGSRERVLHGDVPPPALWGEDSPVPRAGPVPIHLLRLLAWQRGLRFALCCSHGQLVLRTRNMQLLEVYTHCADFRCYSLGNALMGELTAQPSTPPATTGFCLLTRTSLSLFLGLFIFIGYLLSLWLTNNASKLGGPYTHTHTCTHMYIPAHIPAVSTQMAHWFMWVTDQDTQLLPGSTKAPTKDILKCKQVGLKKFSSPVERKHVLALILFSRVVWVASTLPRASQNLGTAVTSLMISVKTRETCDGSWETLGADAVLVYRREAVLLQSFQVTQI